MPKKYILLVSVVAMLLAALAILSQPPPASAQCGSSVSSCKDCHEVKKQAPVNTVGAWHSEHAFGDFCEFCHSGNVKAKDKAAAHVGLMGPLADVRAGCQSCHPNDFTNRAGKYATTLGVAVGTGSAPAAAAAADGSPAPAAGECGPAAPTGGQVIDLNRVYADTLAPRPTNWGNVVLLGLIAATLLLLFGLIWYYENPMARAVAGFRQLLALPTPLPGAPGSGGALPVSAVGRPDVGGLLPLLAASDPETVRALTHLLSDRESGPKVIKALSNLDFRALASLSEGDEKRLAALMALAREMHS